MSRIDITTSAAPLSDGMLQTANPLDATLQVVTDNVGNSSTVSLSTTETQINSTLRIKTDNAELLDIENSSGNRFNINRDVQKVNLDFASNPTGSTSIVGAIRTFIDGTNLTDVAQFQENGQVTFTERVKLESDSTVTTQTSSVIQSSTTNASLVIAPNGTGALMAQIPDGAVAGGNARGGWAVDLQLVRGFGSEVASGAYSFAAGFGNTASGAGSIAMGQRNLASQLGSTAIGGGGGAGGGVNATAQFATAVGGYQNNASGTYSGVFSGTANTVSSNYGVVSGGQSNTASTGTHATVVGGQSNTASGIKSIAGGNTNTASNTNSVAFGINNTSSGVASFSAGNGNNTSGETGITLGYQNTNSGLRNLTVGDSNINSGWWNIVGGNGNQCVSDRSFTIGQDNYVYLVNQITFGNGNFSPSTASAQQSMLTARREATLTTASTTVLSLDGTGVTNLIIPYYQGSFSRSRAWNVQVNWVAMVTLITGTATGISVGDVVTSIDLLAFKRILGVSSASAHTSAGTKTMVTTPAAYAACAIAFTAGASQEMALTFTGPTFVGGGSVDMRVVASIELTEVAY